VGEPDSPETVWEGSDSINSPIRAPGEILKIPHTNNQSVDGNKVSQIGIDCSRFITKCNEIGYWDVIMIHTSFGPTVHSSRLVPIFDSSCVFLFHVTCA
jgi:hypothetical protein